MEKARSYYENADRIVKQLKHENSCKDESQMNSLYESLMNNLSNFYAVNLDYSKALEYNGKAFNIRSEYRKEYLKWIYRGYIYFKLKKFSKSIECYNTALKVMERDHGSDFTGLGQILSSLGQVYLNLNDYDKALENLQKLKTNLLKNAKPVNVSYSSCLNEIGQVYQRRSHTTNDINQFLDRRKKDLITALEYYQQSLAAISQENVEMDYSVNPKMASVIDKNQLLICLKNKAEALKEMANLEEKTGDKKGSVKYLLDATKTYKFVNEIIHVIRSGFISQESRLFLAENEHSSYLGAVEAGMKLFLLTNENKYFEEAFEFSERSRSTDFLTMIRNTRAKQIGGMPDSLVRKELELKSEIEAYKNFVFNENNKAEKDQLKINLWQNKIFDLEHSYDKLIAYFEKAYPRYYDFKYSDQVISLKEIQSNLKAREALIEYATLESGDQSGELLIFLVTKNKMKIYRKDIDSSFSNSINSVLQFLKNKSVFKTRKQDYVSFASDSYKLYNNLISPISAEIEGHRLIVIPDGILAYLPFDCLVTSAPDTSKMDFKNLKYLINDHAVSYTYSATLLYNYFNTDKKAHESLGAYIPKYGFKDQLSLMNGEQLFDLQGARFEIDGISKLLEFTSFMDQQATKEKFKNTAGDFDILHLAMHTIINDSLPMYSKLIFSPAANDNGALNTYEIYNMNLRSRLTVLSACNTGSGKLAKGEGVMSLARAFLYAGCPAIIMTLWNVQDKSSATLMVNFYKFLLNGYSKDEALRKAKIIHIQNADPLNAHPYYWAGYVLIGDQNPLFQKRTLYFLVLIIFVIGIILLEKLNRKIKNKKRKDFPY
jgi:CHAT domain-containing protein